MHTLFFPVMFLSLFSFACASDADDSDDDGFSGFGVIGSRVDEEPENSFSADNGRRSFLPHSVDDLSSEEESSDDDSSVPPSSSGPRDFVRPYSFVLDPISGLPMVSGLSGVTGATGYCGNRDMFFIAGRGGKASSSSSPRHGGKQRKASSSSVSTCARAGRSKAGNLINSGAKVMRLPSGKVVVTATASGPFASVKVNARGRKASQSR